MKILLLHSFLFIQLFGYASCMEEGFLLRNDTITPSKDQFFDRGTDPKYPGGEIQLVKDLSDNLVYPKLEFAKGIEGTVWVQFFIETDGSINEIKIARGIKGVKNFDNSAIEAVKKLKRFSPAILNGKPQRQLMTLPVRFTLHEDTDVKPKE